MMGGKSYVERLEENVVRLITNKSSFGTKTRLKHLESLWTGVANLEDMLRPSGDDNGGERASDVKAATDGSSLQDGDWIGHQLFVHTVHITESDCIAWHEGKW